MYVIIKSVKQTSIMQEQKLDNKTGYFYVSLLKDNVATKHYIHELVAKTFVPNPENKTNIRHINGIKSDNRADNLEWID